ncbi:hypothetical protein FNV43_RR11881 [Rhamnella rubrinervis]|uniref:RNase H type-1 domain-containing protein n=1 Tax=Rhamnella rubrinervis TaxID=2594499 RepID=A0A8K0H6D2_9ROSA|nr:hypothetical protein FNV43_RR11881 [Rhamnella rubrinervis]
MARMPLIHLVQPSHFNSLKGSEERWRAPPKNWYRANTDAAFKDGRAALVLVLRDEKGKVLYLASKLDSANSAKEAELKALVWGFEKAKMESWELVVWSSDALNVVKEVESCDEPVCWESRYSVLFCRGLLKEESWKLMRNARSANIVADLSAKFTTNTSLLFSRLDNLFTLLSVSILNGIVEDQLGVGLSL